MPEYCFLLQRTICLMLHKFSLHEVAEQPGDVQGWVYSSKCCLLLKKTTCLQLDNILLLEVADQVMLIARVS